MQITLKNHSLFTAVHETIVCILPEENHGESAIYAPDGELVSELIQMEDCIISRAIIAKDGKNAEATCKIETREQGKIERKSLATKAVKTAAYKAAVKLLDITPEWGAMSGVKPAKPIRMRFEGEIDDAEADAILRDEFYISPHRRKLTIGCAKTARQLEQQLTPKTIAIYIGIPFCPSRCAYCSFVSSVADKRNNYIEPYLAALCREIAAVGEDVKQNSFSIDSIYIGGGTPTTLNTQQLEILLDAICTHLPKPREFTVEAGRPETITKDKLISIKNHSVHRISINPQSMNDEVLRAVGRMHTVAEIIEKYEMAQKIGGFDINMDLIAGLPRDTNVGFLQSVHEIIKLEPANITVHCLARKRGRQMEEFGSELNVQTIDTAHNIIYNARYKAYYLYKQKRSAANLENVGFAKDGKISRYNICMMEEICPVIALGAGGVTRITRQPQDKIIRQANPKYAKEYIENIAKIAAEKRNITI